MDILYSNEFLPLISRPTRISTNSATLIDNIFTNNHDGLNCSINGILVTDISDHFPIFHVNQTFPVDGIESCFVTRIYNNRNKQAFSQAISEIHWLETCSASDTQKSFDLFHNKLIFLHNKFFPKTMIKRKYCNRKPWLSEALRTSIRHTNKLYHRYRKIPSVKNETVYKKYRNKLNNILKVAEKKHYHDLIKSHKGDMKKSWAIIKNIVNKHKKPRCQSKFKMSDGSVTENKQIISENFNDFFVNVGPTLAKCIPKIDKSPLQHMGNRVTEPIYLNPVTHEEIKQILFSLKNSATGWDDIGASILKLSSESIVQPLSVVCNISLSEGIFPHQLKIANVIPLYKSDDPMYFNHYRPVSLLCMLSKVFERAMYSRLLAFLETFKILYQHQYGFRRKHSTYMALMVLIDKITKALENGEFIIGVFSISPRHLTL